MTLSTWWDGLQPRQRESHCTLLLGLLGCALFVLVGFLAYLVWPGLLVTILMISPAVGLANSAAAILVGFWIEDRRNPSFREARRP